MLKNLFKKLILNIKEKPLAFSLYTLLTLAMIIIYLLVSNNYSYYKTPIAKITNITTSTSPSEGSEPSYTQSITALIKNGDYKGKTIILENIYSFSCVYDEKYTEGSDIFISIQDNTNSSNTNELTGKIIKLKRDKYIVLMVLFLSYLLIIFCKLRGFLTLLSLIFNIAVFYFSLDLYTKGINILMLSIFASLFFSIVSLIIISGPNKKTLSAIVSTLSSVLIVTLLSVVILLKNNDIDYSFMDFLYMAYEQYDANLIFISEILLCGLGAIMDISITMSSTVSELINKDSSISAKDIFKSCRELGHDVMGTMVNVMLFTNLGGCIPFFILSMKNGVSIVSLIKYNGFFEIARFLTGSIGILITIPIATFISLLVFRKSEALTLFKRGVTTK